MAKKGTPQYEIWKKKHEEAMAKRRAASPPKPTPKSTPRTSQAEVTVPKTGRLSQAQMDVVVIKRLTKQFVAEYAKSMDKSYDEALDTVVAPTTDPRLARGLKLLRKDKEAARSTLSKITKKITDALWP